MKVKRCKRVKKSLNFYVNNFGFRAPHSILIDGTFCKSALQFKVNIREQLPKYIDAEVRLCTTQCCIEECKLLGPLLYGALHVLTQFEVVPCGHVNAIPASLCMEKMSKQPKEKNIKYFMATQDHDLSMKFRRKVGIPLLYIAHNAINLESPSNTSQVTAQEKLSNKMQPACFEHLDKTQSILDKSKVIRKRKKTKGPNPLSCQKKKTKV